MASAYENAVVRRADKAFLEGYLKNSQEKQEQEEKLSRIVLGDQYDNILSQHREEIVAEELNRPERAQEIFNNRLNVLNKEAQDAEDLEAILDSAPFEKLSGILPFLNYDNGNVKDAKTRDYHAILGIGVEFSKANRENDEENARNILDKVGRDYTKKTFLEEYADAEESTKEFISEFFQRASVEFISRRFNNYFKESQKYFSNKANDATIRKYMKTDMQEDQKPIIYELITRVEQER